MAAQGSLTSNPEIKRNLSGCHWGKKLVPEVL